MADLRYQAGFGNVLSSEAEPGALPAEQNSPQHPPYELYAEQINGTGFTVEKKQNRRTWMYRLRPHVYPAEWTALPTSRFVGTFDEAVPYPGILRFAPLDPPGAPTDWLEGLITFAGAGDPGARTGAAIHLYSANRSMERSFVDLDGDLLVVPARGALRIRTELGWLAVPPGEIAILPRGLRFQVHLADDLATGFVAELFSGHLDLPERGPVGANSMADARHFRAPVADYSDDQTPHRVVARSGGRLWATTLPFSPYDVVAWHGSYAPFVYDLLQFNSLWTVNVDHTDPSILSVLTAPWDDHGRNAIDVIVFRGRWDPTEHTFRPPYFHRNSATEFNMVLQSPGNAGPWLPGASSFTPYLQTHGVSADTVRAARARTDDSPSRVPDDSLWLQFESTFPLQVLPWMLEHEARDRDYLDEFTGWPPSDLSGSRGGP